MVVQVQVAPLLFGSLVVLGVCILACLLRLEGDEIQGSLGRLPVGVLAVVVVVVAGVVVVVEVTSGILHTTRSEVKASQGLDLKLNLFEASLGSGTVAAAAMQGPVGISDADCIHPEVTVQMLDVGSLMS